MLHLQMEKSPLLNSTIYRQGLKHRKINIMFIVDYPFKKFIDL